MDYPDFFHQVLGKGDQQPYGYQRRLANGPWPDLINAPTGTGKTRAVGGAWLFRRYLGTADTPRRLIYCLPMRSLVEQTADQFRIWLERADPLFTAIGQPLPKLYIQMGGNNASDWIETPEHPAILIGTQDMLLSGALNRRYAASRYSWPMHFALLNNDALWVHDEVQLMGPGAATSAQLAAFRAALGCTGPVHSLWMSATLDPKHLATVDFRASHPNPSIIQLDQTDRDTPTVARLLHARKALQPAPITLNSDNAKKKAADYIAALHPWLLEQHQPGSNTLVILNTVERAQALYGSLSKAGGDPDLLLVHSRYRPADRTRINAEVTSPPPPNGRIIIATQAIEAGLDISSAALITELAPWSSLVQRFGRCHRYGEYPGGAQIHWIDVSDDLAAPYTADQLRLARTTVATLHSAAPADLPNVREPTPNTDVIRLRDFLDLFDTDADLSGHDLDISRYIRDADDTDLLLFWRDLSDPDTEQAPPTGDELCRVAIGSAARLIKRLKNTPYSPQVWDPLARPAQWRPQRGPLRPGMTLMLDQRAGGYQPDLGFQPDSKPTTPLLTKDNADTPLESEADQADDLSRFPSGIAVELGPHLAHAEDQAIALCDALGDTAAKACVPIAARGHDTGKAHEAFLNMLLANDPDAEQKRHRLWAKGISAGRPRYTITDADGNTTERRYFRHELASMLAWLAHHRDHPQRDLIAYLILAHHGKLRMRLRSLPDETEPPDNRLFARGIWDGDTLPAIDIAGREQLPETTLKLDLMQLGAGPQGPSWTARTAALLEQHGPFRLAWLETLVRLADWRASRAEQENR